MQRQAHYRKMGETMDLTDDFQYKKERLKGKVKKIYQRETRNRLKKELICMRIDN